jgi:hypothetical protein
MTYRQRCRHAFISSRFKHRCDPSGRCLKSQYRTHRFQWSELQLHSMQGCASRPSPTATVSKKSIKTSLNATPRGIDSGGVKLEALIKQSEGRTAGPAKSKK